MRTQIKIISGKRRGELFKGLIKYGTEAYFLKIDKNFGIKWFYFQDDRDHAFRRQKEAYKMGFAPPVFGKMKVKIISSSSIHWLDSPPEDGGVYYAYITAVAKRVGKDYGSGKLVKLMSDHGFNSGDTHPNNVGFYKGKEVMIDFGPASS